MHLSPSSPKDSSTWMGLLHACIRASLCVLATLMTLVILWSVADVVLTLYEKASNPPFLHINIDDLIPMLGAFLFVLIAIEIFFNIIIYLREETHHLRVVLATALMAIARKVIIFDYEHASSDKLMGIGVVIVALGIAYWLVHRVEPK